MDFAATFSTIQKLAPRTLLAIGIASATVLFLPIEYFQPLHLEKLRTEHGFWTGLACLLSWSLVATHFMWWTARKSHSRWTRIRARQKAIRRLSTLTPDEQGFLLPYTRGETTRYVGMGDGVVGGLMAKDIVFVSAVAYYQHRMPVNLKQAILEHLSRHPELLTSATVYPHPGMDRIAW
jgi:Super-infection exclusion protein B